MERLWRLDTVSIFCRFTGSQVLSIFPLKERGAACSQNFGGVHHAGVLTARLVPRLFDFPCAPFLSPSSLRIRVIVL
jgi:hypothetical protein